MTNGGFEAGNLSDLLTQGTAQEKKVGALPPHPLDGAFEKGKNVTGITDGLLNNALFKKAMQNAMKAKLDQEAKYRENPNLRAATPAQSARQAFLTTILAEEKN